MLMRRPTATKPRIRSSDESRTRGSDIPVEHVAHGSGIEAQMWNPGIRRTVGGLRQAQLDWNVPAGHARTAALNAAASADSATRGRPPLTPVWSSTGKR